jgi:hypothetical protein
VAELEKQYIFFDTGKGCLLALVLYSMAVVVLGSVFFLVPYHRWLHMVISLAVFAAVSHYVFAADKKRKTKM